MKKLLAALLAALMLLSVAACSPDTDNNDVNAVNPKGNELDDSLAVDTGTFKYDYIDSTTVCVVSYEGKDIKHELVIPATMNGKTVVAIDEGAFDNLSNITAVTVPDTVNEIGSKAFASCKELTKVSLPASLETLGKGAFYDCTALETVTFTNTDAAKLEVIPESAFQSCKKLTAIDLPDSVTAIGKGAFFGCVALETVSMPAKLATISQQAFQGCTALASVDLPATLTSCEIAAFAECTSLADVTFADPANWNVDLSTVDACIDALVTNYNTALVKDAD